MNAIALDNDEMEYVDGGIKCQDWWWGYTLYLNSSEANMVAGGIGILSILADVIPNPVVARCVDAVLKLIAGTIAIANASGRGVHMDFNNVSMLGGEAVAAAWTVGSVRSN